MVTIYEIENFLNIGRGGIMPLGSLTVKYDNTDHFWFACHLCMQECEVIEVRVNLQDLPPGVPHILYLEVRCPVCDRTGGRKVALGYYAGKGEVG